MFTTTFVSYNRQFAQRTIECPLVTRPVNYYGPMSGARIEVIESVDVCPRNRNQVRVGIYCEGKWDSRIVDFPIFGDKDSCLQGAVSSLEQSFLSRWNLSSLPKWEQLSSWMQGT